MNKDFLNSQAELGNSKCILAASFRHLLRRGTPMIQLRLGVLWLVPLVLLPALAGPSYAGIFFGRKNKKPTPAERVPELLAQVKNDGDESKRAAAAQELRHYDTGQFPMIVPMLIDALLSDREPGVRAAAAQSLGKIRPISQQAGMALEYARANDSSLRVQLLARSALLQYYWNGYRSMQKEDRLLTQTKEPPLADDNPAPPIVSTTTSPPTRNRLAPQAPDGSRPPSGYRSPRPGPFPVVPTRPKMQQPPLTPSANPTPAPPPSGGSDGGPELFSR